MKSLRAQNFLPAVLVFFFTTLAVSVTGNAETATLKINGDLMVHPSQVSQLFASGADKIKNTSSWAWPSVAFTAPYKTWWTNVQALGPFDVTFTPDGTNPQVLAFDLNWNTPQISVGQFNIDDTITKIVGGNTIIVHIAGQCNGMSLTIPNGQWKVSGHLNWSFSSNGLEITWLDFNFTQNGAAVAQSNLGVCQGPQGLVPALQEEIASIAKDQSWLHGVLQTGVETWVHDSLGDLQNQLLAKRVVTLKPGLDASWNPESLSNLAGGRVRILGHLEMDKTANAASVQILERTYADSDLAAVTESGFVLPTTTLQEILNFTSKTGDLSYRTTSDAVPSFKDLMANRMNQFFVWPDLMQFAADTLFYFDITTSTAPVLTQGYARAGGGISYAIQAPILVHQWAPWNSNYLPYVDFMSAASGRLQASVKDNQLTFALAPNDMTVTSVVRPEYQKVRTVNGFIATSMLGSKVKDYLAAQPFSVALPTWNLADSLVLSVRDVQVWKQSFRVPLALKSNK